VQKNNPPASTASIFWLITQVTALSFRTVKCVIFVIHLTITNLREEEEKEIAVRAGVCRCWVLSKSCNYIHLKHFLRKGISRLERELAASAHKSEIIISPPDAPSSSLSALLLLLQFFSTYRLSAQLISFFAGSAKGNQMRSPALIKAHQQTARVEK